MTKTVRVPEDMGQVFSRAEELVARWFKLKTERPEQGRIEIDGERYLLIRAESISAEFFDQLESLLADQPSIGYEVARNLLYHYAAAIGRGDARATHEAMELTDPIERLAVGPVLFSHTGWAFVDIDELSKPDSDPSKYVLIYEHPNSFEADAWLAHDRRPHSPICVMSAGYSSGWCSESFQMELVAAEICCRAMGDSCCRFIMAPPDQLAQRLDEYLLTNPQTGITATDIEIPRPFDSKELRNRLRESERRVHHLFESATDILLVLRDGVIIDANPAAISCFEGIEGELVGRKFLELPTAAQLRSGEGYDGALTDLRAHLNRAEEGTPCVFEWVFERGNGAQLEVEISLSPGMGSDALLAVMRDITERKRSQKEQEHLRQEVRQLQKMDALGTLAGGVAHDFNNLLTAAMGNVELAQSELSESSDSFASLEASNIALEGAARLVRQLLTFSRTSQNTSERVDMTSVVRRHLAMLRDTIDRRIQLRGPFEKHGESPAQSLIVLGDPTYLAQTVVNLVLNARDAVGQCTEASDDDWTPEIAVRLWDDQRTICLEISDNGCGMDRETRERAFEPFFTTKHVGEGTGLGLSTVYGIVQQHGGTIDIQSDVGRGTTVVVKLPRIDPWEATDGYRSVEKPVDQLEVPKELLAATILIVDDEAQLRAFARRVLSRAGFTVIEASDGVEAIHLFEANRADIALVLLDLTMPQLSGQQTLEQLLEIDPNVRVILSSGYFVDTVDRSFQRDGASGFLAKPYTRERLLHRVLATLEERT